MRRIILATFLSSLPGAASAAPDERLTFYGVTMMAPIAVPECGTFTDPVKFRTKYGTYPYAPPTSGPCYRRDDRSKSGSAEPMTFENIDIQFPVQTAPNVGFGFSAMVMDGKIQALRWMTRGQPQQAAMFALLRGKFGEPSFTTTGALQNGFGAKYESIRATWSLPQTVTAVFQGIDGRIDQGKVEIMSEATRARVIEELSKANKSTPL